MQARPSKVVDATEIAVADEYLAVKARVLEGRERARRLHALAEHVECQVAADEHILGELEGLLGLRAQLQIEQLDRELGGKRLAEVAVAVLERERQPGEALHYKEWFALLRAAGYSVRGQDPLASFLAQINRSPRVESIGQRTGRYRLRAA